MNLKLRAWLTNTIAMVVLLTAATTASATLITHVGSIDGTANDHSEIDFYAFSVTLAGNVTFVVDARGVDFDAGNGASTLDAYVLVAIDDGLRTLDDFLFFNDDGGPEEDSLLTAYLEVGDYIAGVTSCCIVASEFVDGENTSVTYPTGAGVTPDYRLSIRGDVNDRTVRTVPTPATLALLVLGLAGLRIGRRKRATQS